MREKGRLLFQKVATMFLTCLIQHSPLLIFERRSQGQSLSFCRVVAQEYVDRVSRSFLEVRSTKVTVKTKNGDSCLKVRPHSHDNMMSEAMGHGCFLFPCVKMEVTYVTAAWVTTAPNFNRMGFVFYILREVQPPLKRDHCLVSADSHTW